MKKNSIKKVVNAILIVFIFSFLGMSANAQYARSNTYGFNGGEGGWRLGVRWGANFAGFTGSGSEDLGGRVGTHVGMFAEYVMPGNVYLQTGLELSLKGAKESYSDAYEKLKVTANPLYLQIPVHVGYQIGLADDISVNIHAGPYLAFGIAGNWKYSYEDKSNSGWDEEESWNFFGSEKEGGCKAFDFGLGFGIDLDLSSFRIGLGYDAGLVNIGRDSDDPLRNRNFYLSLGYKF